MYTTRPLSLYQDCPEALRLLPEGPNSGYLVLQGDKTIKTSFFGFFKDTKIIKNWLIEDLPFPQNKYLSIITGDNRSQTIDDVYLIPVINQPLSSNRYYAIKADGRQRGEAYVSSVKEDMGICCFCSIPCILDEDPRPFDQDDVYQQFKFFVTNSNLGRFMPTAKSVALDGIPPKVLKARGCQMKSNTPENFYIGEAQGIDSSLRAHLPDFNFWSSQVCSNPVVVGKWYCPFIFIKDGRRKDQVKENVFYEMTLEQQWEQIYAAERSCNQGKKVTVDVIVPTESVKIAGQEAAQEERNNDRGAVWFRSKNESGIEVFVGLSTLIVERMMWEQERVRWIKEQRVTVVKDETYEGTGDWKRFGCYLLVESFVLKRNNGRILLTYDFRHTHQIRSKWE
ncbi:uncharacterized protein LOC110694336 [Chenopodium quinoa]|uniref:Insecticidal crystal toxin domain-containing protein n=1 Tax=Chenopodium quinoa TaxID=63459 RepID=A0A803KVB2_CHEQI|nr:uncharacterized protein LOC110694336 [Chenopodium quinoa]